MTYSLAEHNAKSLVVKTLNESLGRIEKFESQFVLEESEGTEKREKLIVELEAIHVGKTRNHTYYTAEGLKNGIKSWTQPYNKPVLTHHDSRRGEPIGRILSARFEQNTQSGRPGLIFETEITEADAIQKVKDGRYQTVSIGGHTDKVTCNCCGTNRTEEWCEHYPGETYDGLTCHFVIGDTFGEEVSYVNVPADPNAGNTMVTSVTESVKDEETTPTPVDPEPKPEGTVGIKESATNGVEDTDLPKEDPADPTAEPTTPVKESEGEEDGEDPTKEEPKGLVLEEGQVIVEQKEFDDLKEQVEQLSRQAILDGTNKQLLIEEKEVLKQENKGLVEKIKQFDGIVKENIVNEIFSLKEKLGKSDVATKEATLLSLRERALNSLEDLKKDLVEEQKALEKKRPDQVPNPAGAAQTEESGASKDEEKDITAADAVARILKRFTTK